MKSFNYNLPLRLLGQANLSDPESPARRFVQLTSQAHSVNEARVLLKTELWNGSLVKDDTRTAMLTVTGFLIGLPQAEQQGALEAVAAPFYQENIRQYRSNTAPSYVFAGLWVAAAMFVLARCRVVSKSSKIGDEAIDAVINEMREVAWDTRGGDFAPVPYLDSFADQMLKIMGGQLRRTHTPRDDDRSPTARWLEEHSFRHPDLLTKAITAWATAQLMPTLDSPVERPPESWIPKLEKFDKTHLEQVQKLCCGLYQFDQVAKHDNKPIAIWSKTGAQVIEKLALGMIKRNNPLRLLEIAARGNVS